MMTLEQVKEIEAMIDPVEARPKRGERYFDGVFCVNTIYMESLFRKVIKKTFPEFPPIKPPNIA